MKTTKEIVEETVNYYAADISRRSKVTDTSSEDFGFCRYLGPEGRRCAFSRCCKEDEETLGKLESKEGRSAAKILSKFGEGVLKEEYQGHSDYFWNSLQSLHDGDIYWDFGGLTGWGEKKVREILEEYDAQI